MEDTTQEKTQENEVSGASKAAEAKEMNIEKRKIDRAAMAQRMADMMVNGGRRPTQGNNNMDDMDKDREISLEGIAHSMFVRQLQPTAVG